MTLETMTRQPAISAIVPTASALATPLPRVLRPTRAVPADAVRPTRAEVNLANLRHNLRVMQRTAGGAEVWAVLKADGYGHGAKGVARTLERAGATGICVALLEEGIELREAGIRVPILITGGYYGRAFGEVLRHSLTPVLHDPAQVEELADEVRYSGAEPASVHVKIDTGMSRLGVLPRDVPKMAEVLARHPQVQVSGLMTHFACADGGDPESIHAQLDLFDRASTELRKLGIDPALRHAANSAAILQAPRAHLNVVRPGIALFGVEPRAGICKELRPVMQVRTELVAVREIPAGASVGYGATWTAKRTSRIATIPMGYADGLSRALSNRAELLVRGKRAPVAGIVSMDMAMLDVTEIDDVRVGDECVVLGSQKGPLGQDTISAEEIAGRLGTIPWEVLTDISRRVPRFYREP
ncbi:MAG TPA: alanine racemase [Polyangiaceae bacterium]|nr:alanine racemase [Polyangiaceae bacterium]